MLAMLSPLMKTLVFAGALMLVWALYVMRLLIVRLPKGILRRRWYAMAAMNALFVAGYLAYAAAIWSLPARPLDLVVPVVFFFGAIFVWVTVTLSFQTVRDLRIISRLERETFTDPLTGAYNRRFLDRRLAEEVASARRYNLPLSVLMIDVDHFKRVNDAHGHPVGDQALVALAAAISREIRETDFLTRYGGEEFVVIALHTPRSGVVELAERLRKRIESRDHVLTGPGGGTVTLRLTVSIGVACFGGGIDTLERLVEVADENLYRAKAEGRNRIACCDPTVPPARREDPGTIAA